MKKPFTAIVAALLAAAALPPAYAAEERDFLTGVRRLTVEGRRAGEGYFSPDGKRMVFQSEREPGNPFYQIYVMDLASGDVKRISPGIGKTTCAFFRAGSDQILFSSTHADPNSRKLQEEELAFRASGKQRRYSWDFDPAMDVYAYGEGTGELKRLTAAPGYDAEASYSPDGQWIVFSSTRDAYGRALSAAEAKLLEQNPGYFAEIYIMRADGSGQKRLTQTPGYDGGPFFTHDGKRIVWRRFDESGMKADIYTMAPDGSDVKRITDFDALSWAPYEHPSGRYFIFSSSKLGFENFELFIVDAQGTKEPVRVTYSPGFDGLPVPSPDGRQLSWTSSRSGDAGGQIFLAQWNHEKALEALKHAPPRRSASRIKAHVAALASEANEGRLTGSPGERRAGDYLIGELERIGAHPLPGSSGYRVPFQFTSGARDAGSTVTLSAMKFDLRSDVQALSLSDDGYVSAPVVFAGYGISVPQSQGLAYDSYASLDVKDKIVLVLRYFPEKADAKSRNVLARYSALRYKALAARERGAKALLVVTGPNSPNAGETIPMSFDTALAGSGIVAASVSAKVADALLAGSGKTLAEAQSALDSGDPRAAGVDLAGVTAAVRTSVERETRTGNNVLAYLPANAAPAADKPWIVIGAHYDHLGRGEAGNSLAGKGEAGRVHFGADDNASGAAAVLALAEALSRQPRRANMLLAFWSGEEIGLLGSRAFLGAPPVPVNEIAAYLNFDMVGRMQDNKLIVQATGTSPAWPRLLERANVAAGFDLALQGDPYQPTDVASFNQAGVPSLNFFTGAHADYHKPSDTADKIDYEDLGRVADFAAAIARRLGELDRAPVFTKVEEKTSNRPSRAGVRLFTGTIPDYASTERGLALSGVVGGGPADKAGLQKGDVIIELAGHSVVNIYDYTYALDALKVGVPAKVVYLRNGSRRETTLTPAARN